MNIYKLISPVNKFNYVNIPIIKNNQDYNYQHNDVNTSATRKLSVLTKGKKYSDKYLRPKINVIANFMQLEQKTIPAINKRTPEIVQNNSMYFSDPNTKYDELLTATPTMLASVEPINYFGCRIVGNYLYNFDYSLIFQIIPHSLLLNYIPREQIKESFIYVDKNKTLAMNDKAIYKNIWMDIKTYRPVHPNYVEYIDINSLIEPKPIGVNLNDQPPDNYYTTPLPLESDSLNHAVLEQQQSIREPIIAEQPIIEQQQQPKRKKRTNKKKQQNNEPSEPFIPDIPTIPIDPESLPQLPDNEEKDFKIDETVY